MTIVIEIIVLLFTFVFSIETEWIDHNRRIREAYKKIVPLNTEITFVKATLVNEDCESVEIEGGKFFIAKGKRLFVYDDYDDIEFNATVGINGIFEYYTDFLAFDKLFQEDRTLLQKCQEALKKHPPPELVKFPIENIMKNTWDKERIKRYLRVSNADLNVYFCFGQTNVHEYESQTQLILKKKDVSFLATNILRVQKKNGMFAASDFGGINELDFSTADTVLSAPSAFEGVSEHTQIIQQDTNPSLENFVDTDEPDITENVSTESQESEISEIFKKVFKPL